MQYDPNAQLNVSAEPDENETADPNLPNIGEGDVDTSLSADAAAPIVQDQDTFNIVLFGLDTRDPKRFTGARSDVMMLLSVDTKNKTIKLTSFMRDILIDRGVDGKNRLNTAILASPENAVKALSDNFGVQADKYAIINFWALSDVIDALGGVDINVKSAEISDMNKSIREINKLATGGKEAPQVSKAGEQHLNGRQAVAYMRIRHVGNGDFERTQRQRTVLNRLIAEMSDLSLDEAVKLANILPKYVRTNMSQADILAMATKLYAVKGADVQEMRIPLDKTYKNGNYKGMSILLIDFAQNRDALKEFLTK
jgi:LCP family protein required for cell wall assembly